MTLKIHILLNLATYCPRVCFFLEAGEFINTEFRIKSNQLLIAISRRECSKMSNRKNNQNILHYLWAVIDHFLRVNLLSICINVSVNNCPHVSTILIKHYRLQYPWYALYKWYCDLNTCGQAGWAAGTGAAPVLALPTCKPAAAARNSHDPRHNQCALPSTGGPHTRSSISNLLTSKGLFNYYDILKA